MVKIKCEGRAIAKPQPDRLGRIGLSRIGLSRIGLSRIGLSRIGLNWILACRHRLEDLLDIAAADPVPLSGPADKAAVGLD
jgi:hypothetical protein